MYLRLKAIFWGSKHQNMRREENTRPKKGLLGGLFPIELEKTCIFRRVFLAECLYSRRVVWCEKWAIWINILWSNRKTCRILIKKKSERYKCIFNHDILYLWDSSTKSSQKGPFPAEYSVSRRVLVLMVNCFDQKILGFQPKNHVQFRKDIHKINRSLYNHNWVHFTNEREEVYIMYTLSPPRVRLGPFMNLALQYVWRLILCCCVFLPILQLLAVAALWIPPLISFLCFSDIPVPRTSASALTQPIFVSLMHLC